MSALKNTIVLNVYDFELSYLTVLLFPYSSPPVM